jgi:hypothetical protein
MANAATHSIPNLATCDRAILRALTPASADCCAELTVDEVAGMTRLPAKLVAKRLDALSQNADNAVSTFDGETWFRG